MVATASGWVMYGSPDLRYCPECQRAATSKARCSARPSALGWLARWVAISGSSTSLTWVLCQGALKRARRARTRRPVGALARPKPLGSSPGPNGWVASGSTAGIDGRGVIIGSAGGRASEELSGGCTVPSDGGATSLDTGLLTPLPGTSPVVAGRRSPPLPGLVTRVKTSSYPALLPLCPGRTSERPGQGGSNGQK